VPPSLSLRPLSPHLQIYRPQLTSVLSIIHRITGMGLSFGAPIFAVWLSTLAMGQSTYDAFCSWFSYPLGKTLLMGWAFCFYFHLANGIRHLFWDIGWGYELKHVYQSGWTVIGVACGLTAFTFWKMVHF